MKKTLLLGGLPDAAGLTAAHISASEQIFNRAAINAHDSMSLAVISSAATVSAVEDVIDDYLGGSQ